MLIIAGEHYESIKNYNKAIECYQKALKRGDTSAKDKISRVTELKNEGDKPSSILNPKDFYSECNESYHKLAKSRGLATNGLIFIPELLSLGNEAILAYLQDRFFSIEYANDPTTYYYVINSFAFQTGIVYAAMWHTNYAELKESKAKEVVANGAWGLC